MVTTMNNAQEPPSANSGIRSARSKGREYEHDARGGRPHERQERQERPVRLRQLHKRGAPHPLEMDTMPAILLRITCFLEGSKAGVVAAGVAPAGCDAAR